MARIWFAAREGGRWKVPSGRAAYEMRLDQLIFKLDLGWQRRLGAGFHIDTEASAVTPSAAPVTKVFVQVEAEDVEGALYPGYAPGWYDSPYSPGEVERRLGEPPSASTRASTASA